MKFLRLIYNTKGELKQVKKVRTFLKNPTAWGGICRARATYDASCDVSFPWTFFRRTAGAPTPPKTFNRGEKKASRKKIVERPEVMPFLFGLWSLKNCMGSFIISL
jgi:hypothetical protein